ncbi:hypothetical protein WMF38_56855 [Sorangium sp. So ce118]
MRNAAKPGRFVTDGSRKFDAAIDARGLTTQAVADALGASRGTVHGWRNGQIRPEELQRLRIAVWSKEIGPASGAPVVTICPEEWLLPEERALVDQLTEQLGAA